MSTLIPMETYARKAHFDYFRQMAYPYVGVTVNVEITDWLKRIKQNKQPFFLSFLYAVSQAANAVPEFRQRIAGEGIVEYKTCYPSYAVALENGTYCYCTLDCTAPWAEFLPYALQKQEEAKRSPSLDDGTDAGALLYISTLPWLSYTALVQPVPAPADSNPRITWGKFFVQDGKTWMPVSVLCHHALVDGLHIAQFYDSLNQQLKK